jgi:hypothetical protein
MLLVFLLLRRPFRGWSRFWLVLVAGIFTAFQYTTGFNEFQALHLSGAPLITLSFAYTWVPICCAVLAFFTRRTWLTRLALCTLALAEATMLAYQGQQVFFSFVPANSYPLSVNILASSTFYQVLGPLLVLIALLALLRLPTKGGFRWFDHGILLAGAFFCARLDEAFWQVQNVLSAMIACHFWRQTHPYARVEPWLQRLQAFLTFVDRLLALALLALAFLLSSVLGIFNVFPQNLETLLFPAHQFNILLLLMLLALALLVILALVLIVRLLRRKAYELGKSERLVLFFSVLTCLLFLWQDPGLASLPLLNQHIQLTGNIFHWSSALLSLLLLLGLALIPCLAFFWLRRSFFASYRAVLNPFFLLVLICAFFQLAWPLFLPLGMLCLLPGVLLAVQIEKAG